MRAVLVSSLVLLLACGGSKKPAETEGETPSSETTAPDGDTTATSDEGGTAAPAASSSPAPAETPAAAPAPAGPTVTGAIDGKPFSPKTARVTHPMQKDGRIFVTLDEHAECGADASPGDGVLSILVTWEDGYKVDLGSLKHGKKGGGEISFARIGAKGKRDYSATFKPTGRVTIVKAPTEQGEVGKLSIDLQSGDYMLSGDLDVQTCVSPKAAPGAGKPAGKKKKK
jgi:hypothetical protein